MKIVLITQARIGSTRLPGKVLLSIGEETLLSIHLKRILKCRTVSNVIVATTHEEGSGDIIDVCRQAQVKWYQGSLYDVLDRFYQAALPYNPDLVVRVTSDCPLLDPNLIDEIVITAIEKNVDYCANVIEEDFPDGQDIEVFKFSSLHAAWCQSSLKSDREHVTSFIRNNSDLKGGDLFTAFDVKCHANLNSIRMTVDEFADLTVIRELVNELGDDCSWLEYVNYMQGQGEMENSKIKRNEGYFNSLKND